MKMILGIPFRRAFAFPLFDAGDGWVLSARLASGDKVFEIESSCFSGDGTHWEMSLSAAQVSGFFEGDFTLYVLAERDGEEVLAGQFPANISALGAVSHNQKMVTALRALSEGKSGKDYSELSIEGRSIKRLAPAEVREWLVFYEKRLAAERRTAGGRGRVRSVKVGFNAT